MKAPADLVSFEQFKPRLRPGQIIPSGSKIIYELSEPFDQIVFPVELADLLLLCSGHFTMREIIEKMYMRQGFVHFKTIFKAVIQLKERGFLINGRELDVPDMSTGLSSSLFDLFNRNLFEVFLGRRVINDRAHPMLFYLLAMTVLIGSIFSFELFPTDFFKVQFLRIDGSYLTGLVFFFIATSVLLSMKSLMKALMLLFLTGRVYNFGLSVSPFAIFFRVGRESLFLVPNKLYLTLYHLSISLSYFFFVGTFHRIFPDAGLTEHAMILSLILTLVDLDPFRKSELSQYLHTINDNDSLTQISSYLKDKSLLTLITPTASQKSRSTYLVLSHVAIFWSLVFGYLLVQFSRFNYPLLNFAIESEALGDKVAAMGIISLGLLAASVVTVNITHALYLAIVPPLKRHFFLIYRNVNSMRHVDWDKDKLKTELEDLPLFAYLSDKLLQKVLDQSEVVSYKRGSKIIIEGSKGQHLFVLLQGTVAVQKQTSYNRQMRVGVIRPISIFGEVAVIEDVTRTADVVAMEKAIVLKVPAENLRKAAQESQYIREIQGFQHAIMVNQFFSSAPMFRELPEEVIHHFTTRGKIEFYNSREVVFEQGNYGDAFYLILRGSVDVIINNTMVKRLKQGGFFGEIAVIADVPRTATIVCEDPAVLLKVSSDAFWEILVQHVEMAIFIESVGEMRLQEDLEFFNNDEKLKAS